MRMYCKSNDLIESITIHVVDCHSFAVICDFKKKLQIILLFYKKSIF